MRDPFNLLQAFGESVQALAESLKPRTVPQAWAGWAVVVLLLVVVAVFLDVSLRGVP